MLFWRQAGLNYVQFSNAAAKVVRRCVQENLQKGALKREESYAKVNKWENGKLVQQKAAQ